MNEIEDLVAAMKTGRLDPSKLLSRIEELEYSNNFDPYDDENLSGYNFGQYKNKNYLNDITPTSNPSSIYSSQAQLIAKHDSISNFSENTYGAATDIDFPFVSATVKNQLTASKFSISDLKQKSSLKHIEGVSNDKKANVQKSQEKIIQCDRFRKFEFNDKENINLSQVDMNSFHHPQPLQIQIISPINSEQPLTLKIHPTQQNSDEKQIASKSQRNSKNSNKNNSRLSSQRRSQRNSVKSPKKEYQQTQNNGDFQKYESQNSLQLTTVEQREEEELRECTFKPQLNSNSLRLAQNNEKIESKAEKIAKLKIQRQINMKAIQEYREQLKIQENCTFKPQINQKSEKMVENRIKQIQECQNYDEQYLGHKRASRQTCSPIQQFSQKFFLKISFKIKIKYKK
eukprot:403362486